MSPVLEIIATIVVIIGACGIGWYLSGRIIKPAQEEMALQEALKPERIDIWQGFLDARVNNPPAFKENDIWGVLA